MAAGYVDDADGAGHRHGDGGRGPGPGGDGGRRARRLRGTARRRGQQSRASRLPGATDGLPRPVSTTWPARAGFPEPPPGRDGHSACGPCSSSSPGECDPGCRPGASEPLSSAWSQPWSNPDPVTRPAPCFGLPFWRRRLAGSAAAAPWAGPRSRAGRRHLRGSLQFGHDRPHRTGPGRPGLVVGGTRQCLGHVTAFPVVPGHRPGTAGDDHRGRPFGPPGPGRHDHAGAGTSQAEDAPPAKPWKRRWTWIRRGVTVALVGAAVWFLAQRGSRAPARGRPVATGRLAPDRLGRPVRSRLDGGLRPHATVAGPGRWREPVPSHHGGDHLGRQRHRRHPPRRGGVGSILGVRTAPPARGEPLPAGLGVLGRRGALQLRLVRGGGGGYRGGGQPGTGCRPPVGGRQPGRHSHRSACWPHWRAGVAR